MPALDFNKAIDLSELGLLQVSGNGAKPLLQGQLTCNVEDISPHQSRLGAHCNPQGRILSLFRLFFFRDDYYLQMPNEVISSTMVALQKYAPFFKVNLLDASGTLSRVSLGNQALPHTTLPTAPDQVMTEDAYLLLKLPGNSAHYEIIGERTAIQHLNLAPIDAINVWKYRNIIAGIPSIYPSTIGKFLPHEINLPEIHGVSFDKGCYTGQEIIARMQYRGQLKKRMVQARAHTTTLPLPGDAVFREGPCGTIVDSCWENENHCLLLVVANNTDVMEQQLFLDPAKTVPVKCLSLSSGGTHV